MDVIYIFYEKKRGTVGAKKLPLEEGMKKTHGYVLQGFLASAV